MADECCGPQETTDEAVQDHGPQRIWEVRELQLAALAAVLLAAG